jgi:hypothetical protein
MKQTRDVYSFNNNSDLEVEIDLSKINKSVILALKPSRLTI